jgi:hypothetical protein
MGVYIYTLRSKTVALGVLGLGKVRANLLSYAYRHTSYWKGEPGERSYTFMTENAERNAEKAFANYQGGHVIMGDLDDGLLKLEGSPIYTDLKEAVYVDTVRLKANHVGWVGVQGKSLFLSKQTPWRQTTVIQGPILGPQRQRSVMDDLGRITHEVIRDGSDTVEVLPTVW